MSRIITIAIQITLPDGADVQVIPQVVQDSTQEMERGTPAEVGHYPAEPIPVEMINQAQIKTFMAFLKPLGLSEHGRRQFTSYLLDRPVSSTKEITFREAADLIMEYFLNSPETNEAFDKAFEAWRDQENNKTADEA